MKQRAWVYLFLGALTLVLPYTARSGNVIHVPRDYPTIGEALAAAEEGAIVQVAPGEYAETLLIDRPLILRAGGDGVVVIGDEAEPTISIVDTSGVTVRGLTIVGGENGILVLRSRDVVLRNNVIRGSRLVGIRVRMGAADIVGNTIIGALPPYGRGIHITNSMDWPTSTIRGNMISDNAMSGITTNMAMVRITGNTVRDNGKRGIAVTEMSEAVVVDNQVSSNAENGIYVSDQSTAIVCDNTVTHSRLPTIEGVARYGNGITVDYRSRVQLHDNVIVNNENNAVSVLHSSQVANNENVMRGNGADVLWMDESSAKQRSLDLPLSCRDE